MSSKLEKSFKQFDNSVKKEDLEIPGRLGTSQGVVEVPNRKPFVYVRLRKNNSELIQAYNSEVQPTYDLPVIVIREGNRYVIKGKDGQAYQNWTNDNPYMSKHGESHRLNPSVVGGGSDVVWVEGSQFLPSLVFPFNEEGGMSAILYPSTLKDRNGAWKVVGGTGTPDLTPYKPRSGSSLVLISFDTMSGNPYLHSTTGTYLSESVTGTASLLQYLPAVAETKYQPVSFVRLVTGTSSINWNNLYDVRQFIQDIPTGSSGVSDHESLTGLLGGSSNSHWHLDSTQINQLVSGTATGLHLHTGTYVEVVGNQTVAGTKTFSSDVLVPDEAYDATAWNGNLEVPTKNAIRDKIETLSATEGKQRSWFL